MKKVLVGLLSILFLLFTGCNADSKSTYSEGSNGKGNLQSTKGFLEQMTRMNYKYDEINLYGEAGLLSGKATVIEINDERIQIYEYKDKNSVEKDVKSISKDGSLVGGRIIEWIASPHFYKNENLIVFYVGDNKDLIVNIEKMMGKQFAGRK